MKIIGISGSPRKKGNTAALVQEALKPFISDNVETELLYLCDYQIKGCTGCEGCKDTCRCVIEDDMQQILPRLLQADAVVLGSPTYFYNVSAVVKAFIDRMYCLVAFDESDRSVWVSANEVSGGKYAVVIAVCEQLREEDMGCAAEVMEKTLACLGYRIVSTVKALNFFAAGEVLKNDRTLKEAGAAGEKLYKTLKLRTNLHETLARINH